MIGRLAPVLIATGMVILTIALTAMVRTLGAGWGFFVERDLAVTTLVVGLTLTTLAYGLACYRLFRRGRSADMLALRITALVVLIPVLLTLVLPQHPAP
jgi:hypothetical protein